MTYLIISLIIIFSLLSAFFIIKQKKILSIISVILTIIFSVVSILYFSFYDEIAYRKPDIKKDYYEKIRFKIAGFYFSHIYPNSRVLLITDKNSQELAEIFRDSVGDGITVLAEEVKPNVSRWGNKRIKYPDLNNLIKKYPECDIFVSACGLPWKIHESDIWKKIIKNDKPKFALIEGNIRNFYYPMKKEYIIMAVCEKPYWTYTDKIPDDPELAFQQRYLLIDNENLDDIQMRYRLFRFDN